MSVQLAPSPVFRAVANDGTALVGGQLFTYVAGTTTPQATYIDVTQTTPNTNPIILNSRGEANVWLVQSQTYKFVLQDALGNLIWSVDQIAGNNLPFGITVSAAGNVTIGPPTSGLALTVNAASGQQGILINADTTNGTSALQSHVVANAVAGGLVLQNQSLGTAAAIVIDIQNTATTFVLGISGAGFTGTFVPGGPSGQCAGIVTNGPVPLAIGTNATTAQVISAGGNVSILAPPSGVALTVTQNAGSPAFAWTNGAVTANLGIGNAFSVGQLEIFSLGTAPLGLGPTGNAALNFYTNSTNRLSISGAGILSFLGGAGQGQLAGWGTPTGFSVVPNFPGATATLLQTSTAVAEIIAFCKNIGFFAA
jgi:uncharacterized membrane protein